MDKTEEEFLNKLKATFKIEADEHIQTISSGLLDLDKTPDARERSRILETIYREAHSLKGAARAVSSTEVEKICQAMETVLSSLKKNELNTNSLIIDTLLDSIDCVAKLISTDEALPLGDLLLRLSLLTSRSDGLSDNSSRTAVENGPDIFEEKHWQKLYSPSVDVSSLPDTTFENSTLLQDSEKHATAKDGGRPKFEVEFPHFPGTRTSYQEESTEPAAPTPRLSRSIEVERFSSSAGQIEAKLSSQTRTVRIQISKLDSLLYQVEEMVTLKMAANQRVSDLKTVNSSLDLHRKQWAKIHPEIRILKGLVQNPESYDPRGNLKPHLLKILNFLDCNETVLKKIESGVKTLVSIAENDSRQSLSMVDDLLEDMKSVLMLPASTVLEIFPRTVREIATAQKKKVRFTVDGGNVEIDRRILEEMKDPLLHLVRNSVDHGIERPEDRVRKGKEKEGSLKISISQLGAKNVEIVISDDGSGIDSDKVKSSAIKRKVITELESRNLGAKDTLNLVFRSEVSTSPIITDLSGRGLGLAIVREKVEGLGGVVTLESRRDAGTEFRIELPVTLATFRGALVQVGEELFVLPTTNVIRVCRVKRDSIRTVENHETITLDDQVLSLVKLADVLEIEPGPNDNQDSQFLNIVIMEASGQKIGFSVDAILNEQEVLVKSLGRQLSRVRNVSAATVLGSGRIAPILNVPDLVKSAMLIANRTSIVGPKKSEETSKKKSILVVEDSITSRMLLKNILESAGYDVQTAVDGADAWATLKTGVFDIVISDIEMPRMDGFELTARIRADQKFRNMPVVVVTSLESREDRERGVDVGANAYIVKSGFEQNNLLSVLERLV